MIDPPGNRLIVNSFFPSPSSLIPDLRLVALAVATPRFLPVCLGYTWAKCPDCPQHRQSPRVMQRVHSATVNFPSEPKMLVVGFNGSEPVCWFAQFRFLSCSLFYDSIPAIQGIGGGVGFWGLGYVLL